MRRGPTRWRSRTASSTREGRRTTCPPRANASDATAGAKAAALGFSAVQLDLEELVAQDLLTVPPAARRTLVASEDTTAALGYLHANCSHCHNQERPPRSDGYRCFDPEKSSDFSLRWNEPGPLDETATYRTAVGSAITPGHPEDSLLLERIRSRDRFPPSMPPLATERVDGQAVLLLARWIESL